ncbi:MAG TPA: DoxX family protein [Phycisphaerae bacterium]|nr:DoxX family protein [Phycisphaerae bacterium]
MNVLLAPFKWIGHYLPQVAAIFQSPILVILRLALGVAFIFDGKVKLSNLTATANHLASWNIPHPYAMAIVTGSAEFGCGILLIVGLASRIASLPLIVVMCAEYIMNPSDHASFRDLIPAPGTFHPGHFMNSDPFPFLCAALVIFAFGPGAFSVDALLKRMHTPTTKAAIKASKKKLEPAIA